MSVALLNVVERTPWPCPWCPSGAQVMQVFTDRVRWVCCGHETTLHRLHAPGIAADRCQYCPHRSEVRK